MDGNILSKIDILEDRLNVCSYVAFSDNNKWSYKIYSIKNNDIFEQESGYRNKNEARFSCFSKLSELAK